MPEWGPGRVGTSLNRSVSYFDLLGKFEARMGPYAALIPRAERTPVLDPIVPALVGRFSVTLRRKATALV
jgi:hypothetical protein